MNPPVILKLKLPGDNPTLWHFTEQGQPIMYHVGISGGKDSTALLLFMVHESGIPLEQLSVTFTDTLWEEDRTYKQVNILNDRVFPITWIGGNLGFFELARKKKRFPARRARFCTQELKMKPSKAWIDSLSALGFHVIPVSGVRAEESEDRKKLPEWGNPLDSYYGLQEWRPLLAWLIERIWLMHRRYGVPRNELYDLGFNRVGCFPCINSNKKDIRMTAKLFPQRIDTLREMENSLSEELGHRVSFFHYQTVTEHFRTIPHTTKDGREVKIITIDDAVAWSRSSDHKGRGRQFIFEFAMDTESPDQFVCASTMGACE
jgi:3'-phosphoadenosine 5'-phosphosulfate sulfotransferase (PAPS reductase)/FAD synthetase